MPLVPAAGYPTGPEAPPQISPTVPEDFLRVPAATPEAFGGAVGSALERAGAIGQQAAGELGQAAITRQDFFNRVHSDAGTTQFMQESHRLQYGGVDPATGQYKPGFYGLYGADAVKAGAPTKQLDDLQSNIAASLPNDATRLLFNEETRRLRTYMDAQISEHYNQQLKVAGKQTNEALADEAARMVATNPNDPTVFNNAINLSRKAYISNAQIDGGSSADPAVFAAAGAQSDAKVLTSAIDGLISKGDYAGAQNLFNAHRDVFTGEQQDTIARGLQPHLDRQIGQRAGQAAFGGAVGGVGGGGGQNNPGNIRVPGTNEFQSFPTPEAGVAAIRSNLLAYQDQRGLNTISGIISRWAPPNENKTDQLIQDAARRTGFKPDEKIDLHDPATMEKMVNAIVNQEGGKVSPDVVTKVLSGQADLTADYAKRSGAFGTPEEAGRHLTTVTAPGGASFRVHELAAPQIQGFLNELAGRGYKIDPATSGGYNNRNKVGVDTNEKSEHAYGSAIDINPDRNKQADTLITDLPPDIGQIAAKWGLKWGGTFDGKKDAMHFEVARLLPGGQPGTQVASAAPPAVSDTGRPAAAAGPTPMKSREELLAAIPDNDPVTGRPLTPEQRDIAMRYVDKTYSEQMQRTEETRARLKDSLRNGAQMLADGREFTYDEATIRSLLPPDEADRDIAALNDAKIDGAAKGKIAGMTEPEIVVEQNRLQTSLNTRPPEDYLRRSRQAQAFNHAAQQRVEALTADPANYVALNNPRLAQLHAASTSTPQAASDYATATLAEQSRIGVPVERQHVLPVPDAQQYAGVISRTPEDAPKVMQSLAAHWGPAWPHVWSDLVTEGKLPAGYQVVGQLADYDPANASILARALGARTKDDKGFETLISAKTLADGKRIKDVANEKVLAGTQAYERSLSDSGASPGQVAAIRGAIEHLAAGRAIFLHEDPSEAAQKAIDAVIGHYEFMPNGGGRVPAARYSDVTANARTTLDGLSLDNVTVPPSYGGRDPDAAQRQGTTSSVRPQDYIDMVKAAPNWVTGPKADRLVLLDPWGYMVRGKDGQPLSVPFDQPARTPPTPPIPSAGVGPGAVP